MFRGIQFAAVSRRKLCGSCLVVRWICNIVPADDILATIFIQGRTQSLYSSPNWIFCGCFSPFRHHSHPGNPQGPFRKREGRWGSGLRTCMGFQNNTSLHHMQRQAKITLALYISILKRSLLKSSNHGHECT